MMRFFVDKKEGNCFILSKEVLQHIKVARVSDKKFICVYQKLFFICQLENNLAKIIEPLKQNHEFNGEVILAAALINIKRFELLIQKACELGATELIPIFSTNVEQKLEGNLDKKLQRWNQISLAAAEQSFRNVAMKVVKPLKFSEVLNLKMEHKFIAHEKEQQTYNKKLFPINSIFLVGPEGGFTDSEVKMALEADFKPISLGKRILRAETASIYLLSRIEEEI